MDYNANIMQLKAALASNILAVWLTEDLLSPRWWFLATTTLVAYVVWWYLVDKRRLTEILLFGSFIAVMNVVIDIIAVLYGLWTYKVRLLPLMPSIFPFDFSVLPVAYMLAYQYAGTWRKYIVTASIATAFFSFGYFPLIKNMGILTFQNWNFIYSFMLRFTAAMFARWVIQAVLNLQSNEMQTLPETSGYRMPAVAAAKPLPNKEDPDKGDRN